jgi:hypothetical protein
LTGPRTVPENSTSGLFPIVGDHEVAVTGAEFHHAALARYAPGADGRARHVAVELVPVPVTHGEHAGTSGIEVWLDGVRIGELAARFGHRYAPLVNDALRRGGRPSCLAGVVGGEHGLEVVLYLPDLRAAAPPRPIVEAGGSTPVLARRAGPAARSYRVPLLLGVAVVGVLGLVTVISGGAGDIAALASGAPAGAAAQPEPPVPAPVAALPPPAAVAQPQPAPAPGSKQQPEPVPPPESKQQPEPAPPPESKRQSEPESEPTSRKDCNPNYSGCVPNAKDVDCEGGPGDGPKYVRGPLRATGKDVYGLDGDNDGVACENGADDRG